MGLQASPYRLSDQFNWADSLGIFIGGIYGFRSAKKSCAKTDQGIYQGMGEIAW